MARFVVFTVDHDQQQTCVDVADVSSAHAALDTVLKYRDYCCHGVAYTPDDLRRLANDCETRPIDLFEEVT